MQVILYSKRWWNDEIEQACKIWAKEKKMWEKIISNREKLKQTKNTFYYIVCKAKR